jgi:hypothetical protein
MCHADELHGLDIRLRRESFPLPTVPLAGKPSCVSFRDRLAAKLQAAEVGLVAFRAE